MLCFSTPTRLCANNYQVRRWFVYRYTFLRKKVHHEQKREKTAKDTFITRRCQAWGDARNKLYVAKDLNINKEFIS